MAQMKIVDVSSAQGAYTIGSYSEDGVIVKLSQGNYYVNPFCDHVCQQAIKRNIPWGLYHYAGGRDPIAEADYFIANGAGYFHVLTNKPILILDWEEFQNSAYGDNSWCTKWLDRVKSVLGVQPGIYGNGGNVAGQPSAVKSSAYLWLAGYPTMADVGWSPSSFNYGTQGWAAVTGWQFSSTPIDKSFFYVDRNTWSKLAGEKGGAVAPQPVKPPQPQYPWTVDGKNLEAMAGDVQQGRVGNGSVRANLLGKYNTAVQAIVNERNKAVSAETCHKILAQEVLAGHISNGDARKALLGNYYDVVQKIINGGNQASVTYTVKTGDNLSAIAARYRTTVNALQTINGIADPNRIFPGQVLKIS